MAVVRALLVGKADPNLADENGVTALAASIQLGTSDVTELLLEHKADPCV